MIFEPYLDCYSSIFSPNLVCCSWDYELSENDLQFSIGCREHGQIFISKYKAYHLNLSAWQITSSFLLFLTPHKSIFCKSKSFLHSQGIRHIIGRVDYSISFALVAGTNIRPSRSLWYIRHPHDNQHEPPFQPTQPGSEGLRPQRPPHHHHPSHLPTMLCRHLPGRVVHHGQGLPWQKYTPGHAGHAGVVWPLRIDPLRPGGVLQHLL